MRYVEPGSVQVDCLFRYDEPVSPHLAAKTKTESTLDKVRVYLFYDYYRVLIAALRFLPIT